jgi:predicted nucleic acid-binding protein
MILKYLLDTCVISEMVKTDPNPKVSAWISSIPDVDLNLSVVTIGEIRKGVEVARPTNTAAALRYEAWLVTLVSHYAGRILPFDEPAAQIWGRLMAHASSSGVEDAQIAAIAIRHGMTISTRNVKHFTPFGVPIVNPF